MDVGHDLENAFISLIDITIKSLTSNIGIRMIPSKLEVKIVS
jgi:hypothetical protein